MMERAVTSAGYLIGLVLLAGPGVMFAVALIAGLRVGQRRKVARTALDQLIAAGNIAWRTWRDGHDAAMAGVEEWRGTIDRSSLTPRRPSWFSGATA